MALEINGVYNKNTNQFVGYNGAQQSITGTRVAPGDWQFTNGVNGNNIQMMYQPGQGWNETVTNPSGQTVQQLDGLRMSKNGNGLEWVVTPNSSGTLA